MTLTLTIDQADLSFLYTHPSVPKHTPTVLRIHEKSQPKVS